MPEEKIKKDDKDEEDIFSMYTSLSVAKKEIKQRWNNKELRKKVKKNLGKVPEIFRDKPKAVIFRNIATPNLELQIASEHAQLMGLDLVVIEFTKDKFCTRNRDKLYLGKMKFFDEKDKLHITGKEKVIAIKEVDNKPFSEIKTLWGEDFVSFHHRILKEYGYKNINTFDASIYKEIGLSPYDVYLKILSICTQSAVLLENFFIKTDMGEKKFTEEVIVPAFSSVKENLGLRPLIVPLICANGEETVCWQYYPEGARKYIKVKQVSGSIFEIKETGKYGKGMFATRDIKKGEKIHVLDGKLFSLEGINKQVSTGEENIDDPLQIDDEMFLDLDDISRIFNHSCDPNAGLRGRSELFAIKNIKKGQEITYDYSALVGTNITKDMWTMKCACESKKCRNIIGNVLSLPPKTLKRYMAAGALQDYIRKQLSKINNF